MPLSRKDQQQPRPRHARRDARQHEDARADHRPDADHRDVQQPHLAAQAVLLTRLWPLIILVIVLRSRTVQSIIVSPTRDKSANP